MTGIDPEFGAGLMTRSPVGGGTMTPQEVLEWPVSRPEASGQPGGVPGTAGDCSGGTIV